MQCILWWKNIHNASFDGRIYQYIRAAGVPTCVTTENMQMHPLADRWGAPINGTHLQIEVHRRGSPQFSCFNKYQSSAQNNGGKCTIGMFLLVLPTTRLWFLV